MLDDTYPDTNYADVPPPPEPQPMPEDPPPPSGDSEKAEKYLKQLVALIDSDKLSVHHTDLNKLDGLAIEDHYRMDLGDYDVEINHSKQPDTGQDFYIMLFNNIKKIENQGANCVNKVILAYTHLTNSQFEDFKEAADGQHDRIRKAEESKRFSEAMNPIDDLLDSLISGNTAPEELSTDEDEVPESNFEEPATEPNTEESTFTTEPKASDYLTGQSL